jgi:hypothetical protein
MDKLSTAQEKVITLMSEKYELCVYSGFLSSVKLQHGGMGKGGETVDVKYATKNSLQKKGFISKLESRGHNLTVYQLTDKAKEYLIKKLNNNG